MLCQYEINRIMKKIITADDFGYSKSVNLAICMLLKNGLLSQASIMVNMPFFEHAVHLIKKYGLKNIGLHFNVTQGNAISDSNIEFKKDKYEFPYEDFIKNEFEAQVNLMKINGIKIHHIDTHHNAHLENSKIFDVIKQYGLRIRSSISKTLDTSSDLSGISSLCDECVDEFVVHPSISKKDLFNTELTDSRINDYKFLVSNSDIIKQIIET